MEANSRHYCFFKAWITILLLICVSCGYGQPLSLMGARLSHEKNNSRIVFEFNKKFDAQVFALKKPYRIVVDLPDTRLATNLQELPLQGTPIRDIRVNKTSHHRLRIVFDVKQALIMKHEVLKPYGQYGYRLLLKLVGPRRKTYHHKKTSSHQVSSAKTAMGRDIIVVIDPGHGGKDPGATGPRGIHEKNVVLTISKDLQRDLNKIPGIKAVLTRRGDYYITLRDRLRIARKDHGDFFIAIHADAFPNRDAKGASVFALSERGATSEAARWLAEKENYSELGGIYLANKSRLLRSVLIDLSQTATITESLHAGYDVLNQLRRVTPLHSQRVEQARFVVLKSPDIPSLLVETGFITNPFEEKRLNARWYQRKLALAIERGIKAYFWRYPPPHTFLALAKRAKKIVVKKGDSLSQLALRYHVSVAAIKALNRLHSSRLRMGEVLQIPKAKV